jgi:hypothetical protein
MSWPSRRFVSAVGTSPVAVVTVVAGQIGDLGGVGPAG